MTVFSANKSYCAFCFEENSSHLFACAAFEGGVATRDDDELGMRAGDCAILEGPWRACDVCFALVNADDWDALADRTVAHMKRRFGVFDVPSARRHFRNLYQRLREQRLTTQ